MTLGNLYKELDSLAPFCNQEDWDNSGLQVGRSDWKAERILLCVDVTKEVIDRAEEWKADVILSHHPLIFHGINTVSDRDFVGQRILRLAEDRIGYIAMHTCFDRCGMRDAIDQKLGFTEGPLFHDDGSRRETPCQPLDPLAMMGSISDLKEEMSLSSLCEFVKKQFDIPHVRLFGDPEKRVRRISVIGGSGKSEIPAALEAEADVLITGDIDHHSGIDAVTQGLSVIDAGHYGLEHVFMDYMEEALGRRLPELQTEKMPVCEPFLVM